MRIPKLALELVHKPFFSHFTQTPIKRVEALQYPSMGILLGAIQVRDKSNQCVQTYPFPTKHK